MRRVEPAVAEWGAAEELLAVLIEVVDHGTRQAIVIAGGKAPKPLKIRRPYDAEEERRPASSEDLARLFGGAVRYTPTMQE